MIGWKYREWIDVTGINNRLQLVVPDQLKHEILHYYHDVPSGGYLGTEQTLEKVKLSFYWPGMKDFVKKYCESCDNCAARKPSRTQNKAPLGSYVVGQPMERVSIDVVGPFPRTRKGNQYILTICDCFTKWIEAFAMKDQESTTIMEVFVDQFVCQFGTPMQLHSDQGTNFQSNAFKEMCDYLSYGTLATKLTMFCSKETRRWDEYLQQTLMAYRFFFFLPTKH